MNKKTQSISINLPDSWVAILKEKAHKISLEKGIDLYYTDLIRMSIGEQYPEARLAEYQENEEI